MRPAPSFYSRKVALAEEIVGVAAAAEEHAGPGETLAGILATEPHPAERIYLCAFRRDGEGQAWLALDAAGVPVTSRHTVRDAASIAALCELAEETAGGGDLDDLLSRLIALRMTEAPAGIEEAEEAARNLQRAIEPAPRLASPEYLDRIGEATRRLERALGEGGSPFAEGMKHAMAAVDRLTAEIEGSYKAELAG
jgi:hypothetical protein